LHALAVAQGNLRVANTALPERNGGTVTIHTVTDYPVNGDLRKVYILELNSDMRFATDTTRDWFRAFQVAESEVAIQFPSSGYSELYAPDGLKRGRVLALLTNEHHEQAEAVLRNAILADEGRMLTTIAFTFPETLDNAVLSPNAQNSRIAAKLIPDMTATNVLSDATRAKVFFPIVVFDEQPPRINAPAAPSGLNPLAEMLQKMTLNNNGTV